jgi:hypothetical protein
MPNLIADCVVWPILDAFHLHCTFYYCTLFAHNRQSLPVEACIARAIYARARIRYEPTMPSLGTGVIGVSGYERDLLGTWES